MGTVLSVNVGLPREVTWRGQTVTTAIFKDPVEGPVEVRHDNLEGDRQADLSVHGGPSKAVYLYPASHYDPWRRELPEPDLAWGAFGENLTVEDVDEESVCIGDEFRVGSARLVVTEPRMPCAKLALRFDRLDMPKLFLRSQRTGFYLGIVEEGAIEAGDPMELSSEHADRLRVSDVTRLYTTEKANRPLLEKAISVSALPERWRSHFARQLEALGSG